jgi:hypothetical protein
MTTFYPANMAMPSAKRKGSAKRSHFKLTH